MFFFGGSFCCCFLAQAWRHDFVTFSLFYVDACSRIKVNTVHSNYYTVSLIIPTFWCIEPDVKETSIQSFVYIASSTLQIQSRVKGNSEPKLSLIHKQRYNQQRHQLFKVQKPRHWEIGTIQG